MSYSSASMSWDHTRLTSSKVVVHNTCSTGTTVQWYHRYRYYQYRYQYRWCATRLNSRLPYCYCAALKSVERYKLLRYRDLAPVFFFLVYLVLVLVWVLGLVLVLV